MKEPAFLLLCHILSADLDLAKDANIGKPIADARCSTDNADCIQGQFKIHEQRARI